MRLNVKWYFVVLISVLLISSLMLSSTSCMTITYHDKEKSTEQQADIKKENSSGSFISQLVDSIKGLFTKQGSVATLSSGNPGGKTRVHPPVRTGDIVVEAKVEAASQSIGKDGGGIAISKPGDPLDGFTLGIPPGAYPDNRTFKISYAPITKQTFGEDLTPISPLITVDNGGGYSDQLIYIKVPVKVPDGYFAMGFLYDEKTKQLEGMPLIAVDANSITVATRHFSNFLINMISKTLLKGDIDTGFCPGIDDFQFVNNGSYISPGGQCDGQSQTTMWYYCTHPDGKDACLYGRYDNNGKQPATPNLWQDDSLAYRLCSVVQTDWDNSFGDNFWLNLGGEMSVFKNNSWQLEKIPGLDDETRYNIFAFSMMATHEPQYLGLSTGGVGHAVVAYKITGNAIYVADPNYPGNTDRKVIYYSGEKKFKPYQSGANREEIEKGNSVAYDNIQYIGKSTISNWNKIAAHWTEFKNGTIGNDKFPQFDPVIRPKDEKQVTLTDGFTTNKKSALITAQGGIFYGLSLVSINGGPLQKEYKEFDLEEGNNKLGVYFYGLRSGKIKFVDYQYFNVIYKPEETPVVNTPMPYTAAGSRLTLGHNFNDWLKSQGYGGGEYMVPNQAPITWNGLNFSGKAEKKPSYGTGIGTIEISGRLSAVPKPDKKPVYVTYTYKSTWDITEPNFYHTGSAAYTITNLPVYVVAMTNQEGHWKLEPSSTDYRGAALGKYLSNYTLKYSEKYTGNPNTRPKDRVDQSWTYTGNQCVDYIDTARRWTELDFVIRTPYNWQTKTDDMGWNK
jgi:hypothetical protein